MKHPEDVKRLFNKPDGEVLQQSDVLRNSFQDNIKPFVARFPQLAPPFAKEWAAATNKARGLIPDFATLNEQAIETQILEILMGKGRNLFQTVMLYTQLAFPDKPAIMKLFGQAQYDSARTNQLKLPVLLRSTYTQISKNEYKPALQAKGLKEEEIDRLNTLADEIVAQHLEQQKAKKARTLAANYRIVAMNAVWTRMSTVCQCAKLVFQNDAARYNLFLLTNSEVTKNEETPAPKD